MATEDPTPNAVERWLPVPGYEGLYEVSDQGRVKSLGRDSPCPKNSRKTYRRQGKILRALVTHNGYVQVALYDANRRARYVKVHRLVLSAFVGFEPMPMQVNHIDFDKKNNRLENLEWCTPLGNSKHAREGGRIRRGEEKYNSVLTDEIVRRIREMSASGVKIFQMARILGIKRATIEGVICGKSWRHVA